LGQCAVYATILPNIPGDLLDLKTGYGEKETVCEY